MLVTNLDAFMPDLKEVINLFGGAVDTENTRITHTFSAADGNFINTVSVDGKEYAYKDAPPEYSGSIEEKRYVKRYAKLSLYRALSSFFGLTSPWGALTGIRPTRLAYGEMEKGNDFIKFFRDVMLVSEEKTFLTQKVIETQKGIYKKDDKNTDFFVFIPFCPSRCKYCSFISSDVKSAGKYKEDYVKALVKEILHSADYVKTLRSIYIGGGTPVALSEDELKEVLKAVDKINCGVEYTVEAGRPDAITKEKLKILADFGVTRVCVNPQTFNDKTLNLLGRNHLSADTLKAFDLVRDNFGFSVNMDLIAGLTGETFGDFAYSLDKTLRLSPDNITVHTLCVKRGSSLAEEEKFLGGGEVEKMVNYAEETLLKEGYFPYYLYRQKYMAGNLENVGFTKKGKACVYNVDAMEEISSCVACGANAVSKRIFGGGERIERYGTPKDVKTYLEKTEKIIADKRAFFTQ